MDRRFLTFLAVARLGNITGAARELNITQPTLTKRLQLLEESLGCKLVERLPRGVRLTEEGRALLPYAERMRNDYFQGLEAVRATRSGHLAELRVGAGPLFHLSYLGRVFRSLRGDHPRTTLRLFADFNSRIIPRLLDGRLDLSFGTQAPEAETAGLAFHRVLTVERGVVLRAGHPLASRGAVRGSAIGGVPWVVFSDTDEMEALITAYLAAQGQAAPDILLQTTSLSLAFEMVASSDAAMVLPLQLEPILRRHGLRVHRAEPSIGILEAGAYARPSIVAYPIVRDAIDRVRSLAGAEANGTVRGGSRTAKEEPEP